MSKKYIKIAIFALMAVGIFGFMFWYVNQYLFKFFASTNNVSVSIATVPETKSLNEEFLVDISLGGQNMNGAELYLSYDASKLQYYKDYIGQGNTGSGIRVIPPEYFDRTIIEKTADIENGKKELTAILVNTAQSSGDAVRLNFKFKPIAYGTAYISVLEKSSVVGAGAGNTATKFELSPSLTTTTVTIVEDGGGSVTPPQALPPVGYWKMDDNVSDNAARVIDSSGKNNHGTINRGSNNTGMDCTTTGKYDGACLFDGVDDEIIVSNKPSLNPSKITASLWAKSNTTSWNQNGMLLSKRNAYIIHPNLGTKTINFYVYTNTWHSIICSPINITDWHYYSMSYDGVTLKGYIDGVACGVAATVNQAINTTDTGDLYFGYDDGMFERRFNGVIDEVKIYDYVRTPEQIVEDMNGEVEPSVITPTEPEPSEPSISGILTPPAGSDSNIKLNLKLKFQGITSQPKEGSRTMDVKVGLAPIPYVHLATEKTATFTAQGDGTWTGTVEFENLPSYFAGTIYIKGPKHIKKKICSNSPKEPVAGGYRCGAFELLNIKEGENDLDFSDIIILAGDLPIQNGVVDAVDLAFIRQTLSNQDPEKLQRGDLNLDGIIDTQDFSMMLSALGFKYDEE